MKSIKAGDFQATGRELLDGVEAGEEYLVHRRGTPVGLLVPLDYMTDADNRVREAERATAEAQRQVAHVEQQASQHAAIVAGLLKLARTGASCEQYAGFAEMLRELVDGEHLLDAPPETVAAG